MFPYKCYESKKEPTDILFKEESSMDSEPLNAITTRKGDEGQILKFVNGPYCGPSFRTQWIVWRVVAGIMGLFFLLCAIVQHNDPDPYLWVPTYIIPCLVSCSICFGLTIKKMEPKLRHKVDHHHETAKVTAVEAQIMLPIYGNANHRLDWLINLHMLYCFGLGLWTLVVHLYNWRHHYAHTFYGNSKDGHDEAQFSILATGADSRTEEAKELMGLCLVIAWLSLVRRNNYVLLDKIGLTIGIFLTVLPIVAWVVIELFEGETKCR